MNHTPLVVPAFGAVYAALAPWVEALLRFAVGMAMVPHGFRMCLGYFKGTGGPISSVPAVAAMYDRKGFRPGWFWAYGTVLTQFVAAPCVALAKSVTEMRPEVTLYPGAWHGFDSDAPVRSNLASIPCASPVAGPYPCAPVPEKAKVT